jgi:hypothetical protein
LSIRKCRSPEIKTNESARQERIAAQRQRITHRPKLAKADSMRPRIVTSPLQGVPFTVLAVEGHGRGHGKRRKIGDSIWILVASGKSRSMSDLLG